jgi:hypothetical protein
MILLRGIRTRRVVQRRHDQNGWSTAGMLRINQIKKAEPLNRGCSSSGYRMAWATQAPRTWDNELSLTFATMAAPNSSTNTASQTNSRQFRSITRLQCYGHIKCQGRVGSKLGGKRAAEFGFCGLHRCVAVVKIDKRPMRTEPPVEGTVFGLAGSGIVSVSPGTDKTCP